MSTHAIDLDKLILQRAAEQVAELDPLSLDCDGCGRPFPRRNGRGNQRRSCSRKCWQLRRTRIEAARVAMRRASRS